MKKIILLLFVSLWVGLSAQSIPLASNRPVHTAILNHDTDLSSPIDATAFILEKKIGGIPLVATKIRLISVNYQNGFYLFQLIGKSGKPLALGSTFTLKVQKPSESTAIAEITAALSVPIASIKP